MNDNADPRQAVLAEYRLLRHAHRPYLAMSMIAHHAATGYMYGVAAQMPNDNPRQSDLAARFEAAEAYAASIVARYREQTPHGYWLCGQLHKERV